MHRINFILLIAFLLAVPYNLAHIVHYIQAQEFNGHRLAFLIAQLIQIFFITSGVLFLCCMAKNTFKIICIFLIMCSAMLMYFSFVYNIAIDSILILNIFETTSDEASLLINLPFILTTILLGIIPSIFIIKLNIEGYKHNYLKDPIKLFWDPILYIWSVKKGIVALFILFIISVSLNKDIWFDRYIKRNALAQVTPANYIGGLYEYFFVGRGDYSIKQKDITNHYKFTESNKTLKEQPKTVVLVIGEGNRASNQHYKGYIEETTPYTEKINNIVNFSNMTSCGTSSAVSVSCLLSYINRDNYSIKNVLEYSNIFSVFNSLQYATYFVSINAVQEDSSENLINLSIKDARNKFLTNGVRSVSATSGSLYDENILPIIKNIQKKTEERNKFIVIYLLTAHNPYHVRYPDKFNVFNNPKVNNRINTYNNAILYSDYMVAEIINIFKHDNTLLYYVSDHGESLGENGKWLHGNIWSLTDNKEEVHVASQFYMSPPMLKLLPNEYKKVVSKKNKALSQDSVFNTLLDCVGVQSKIVDKKLSLCR